MLDANTIGEVALVIAGKTKHRSAVFEGVRYVRRRRNVSLKLAEKLLRLHVEMENERILRYIGLLPPSLEIEEYIEEQIRNGNI